jgi:hypothetical protein
MNILNDVLFMIIYGLVSSFCVLCQMENLVSQCPILLVDEEEV